jgi:hypothetical protein
MPKPLGFLSSDRAQGGAILDQIRNIDGGPRDNTRASVDVESSSVAAADRDQLARDIAAIERASAALRRAEPALESWTEPPAATAQGTRPIWLLIGVLWISTALVTFGAVYAISTLVG